MPIPKRGEVWLADLGFAAKTRPVLILNTPISDSDYALYTVVPHTTSTRSSAFMVTLSVTGLKPGAFNIQGLTAVSPTVFIRKLSELQPNQMKLIEICVKKWLGFQ
ncbi:MAG: type II toxin-antitoxin system PemK/MazF family toxin [Candidatus Poribacteria bacterium]|nr:type II toxin-antitoxin system PemK/MazF family toxin [Candidatus Poribacteria bacterium]MDE0314012.1 type II toxin-antitoxin system PemK/MazF family toxin [Candidatus Poribacteria bacterium]